MRRIFVLGIALGLVAVLGNITPVQADCAYHKTQAALDRAKTSKTVATVPAVDKTIAGQLQAAQSDKPSKPAPQVKN